jgi:hypothetical protein
VYFPKAELKDLTLNGHEFVLAAPPLTYIFDQKVNLLSITGSDKSMEQLREQVSVVRKAN